MEIITSYILFEEDKNKFLLNEFISYLILDSAAALIQLIFIRLGMNWLPYPAMIIVTLYLLLDAGVVIFNFGDLMSAIARRLNL